MVLPVAVIGEPSEELEDTGKDVDPVAVIVDVEVTNKVELGYAGEELEKYELGEPDGVTALPSVELL